MGSRALAAGEPPPGKPPPEGLEDAQQEAGGGEDVKEDRAEDGPGPEEDGAERAAVPTPLAPSELG